MGLLKYFRGSVWNYDFTDKCEQTFVTLGKHPCVVISNDIFNVSRGIVTVLPITSRADNYCGVTKVKIPSVKGDIEASAVMCNQIRTVDTRDLYNFLGVIPDEYMKEIDKMLKFMLGMDISMDLEHKIEIIESDFVNETNSVLGERGESETFIPGDNNETKNREFEVVEEEKIPVEPIKKKEKWNSEQKTRFLLDYESMEINDVIAKYGLTSIKSARNKAYECRKSVGTTKKYKKLAYKVKKNG